MVGEPMYDKQEQYDKIAAGLIEGEVIHAVYDMKGGGTGFLGITNRRLVFYDKSFLGKQKAMVTVPYSRIVSVASKDDSGLLSRGGFFTSSVLTVRTQGADYAFEFRGPDKAHEAYKHIVPYIV